MGGSGLRRFFRPDVDNTSIAIDNKGTPYVVFTDQVFTGKAIAMKYNVSSWVYVGNSTGFSAGPAYSPSIAVDGSGTPYVFYSDGANSSKATVMKYVSADGIIHPENRDENGKMKIYPNPGNSLIIVSCSLLGKENSKISIYNMLGKKVDEIDNLLNQKDKIDYDVNCLKSGIYIIKLTNDNNVSIAKFIKE